MKKFSFILCLIFCVMLGAQTANAEDETLDVFEEYAVVDSELKSENFSISVAKNGQISDMLRFKADSGNISFIIETAPTKGTVEIMSEEGEFLYTPFKDETGTDSFTYRVANDEEQSNIATCSITITDDQPHPEPEPLGFVYADMVDHWGNYSAVKMVERDILKGERIGTKYYFYPDQQLTRIDVIQYLLASLDAEDKEIDTNNTHIFADSAQYPDYINNAAYIAYDLGIIEGEQNGDGLYLNPYKKITRVELIKMLDKAMQPKTKSDLELTFIDKHLIPDWAVQYVKNMVGYGVVQGYDDHSLRPLENVTKAQTVEMMYQMIKYNEENHIQTMSARIKSGFYGKLLV